MKIFYDFQIMMAQRYGGISRYFIELNNAIREEKLADTYFNMPFNSNVYYSNYFGKRMLKYRLTDFGDPFYKFDKIYSKKEIKSGRYDIIHPTYYDPYIIDCDYKGKLIITVYDMIHEKFQRNFSANDDTIRKKRKLLYAADHLIAISESTKKDIIEMYPDISPEKISVVYLGSNMKEKNKTTVDLQIPHKYVLFVGNREIYKNYERFFGAVSNLFEKYIDLALLCIGGGKFTEREMKLHGKWNDRVYQMNASDDILSYAYSHAECFVFPSLYEGFGIPTLEAFACGCPVVLSNTSSMPEVGGDAAEYFDPYDIGDIQDKIEGVLQNKKKRKEMICRGNLQLQKFCWEDIARETVRCYEKVLGK